MRARWKRGLLTIVWPLNLKYILRSILSLLFFFHSPIEHSFLRSFTLSLFLGPVELWTFWALVFEAAERVTFIIHTPYTSSFQTLSNPWIFYLCEGFIFRKCSFLAEPP